MLDRHKIDSIFRPSPNSIMSVIKEIKAFTESEDFTVDEKIAVLTALQIDYQDQGAVQGLIANVIEMGLNDLDG